MTSSDEDDWRRSLTWSVLPTGHAWRRAAGIAFAEHAISLSLAAPIMVISRLGDGINQKAVAEGAGIASATIVRSLDQLEANGLIERHPNPDDRRNNTLHLTEAGKAMATNLERILDELRIRLLSDISDEDGAIAARVLKSLETAARTFG
jgi:MarR family transcriptional regulator for hemolysin